MNGDRPTETARVLAAAATAGLAAGLLDAFAIGALVVDAPVGRAAWGLVLVVVSALAAGAGVAALLGAGVLLGRLAPGKWLRPLLAAAPIAIPLVLFALDLLAGAKVSQISMIGLVRVAVALVTYVSVAIVAQTWLRSREPAPWLVVATIAIAVGCAVVDARVMIGLYPSFHYALRLACLALAACVGYGLAPLLGRSGRLIGCTGFLALVLLPTLASTGVLPGRDPWARRILLLWSQTTGPVLKRIAQVETADDGLGHDGPLAALPIAPAPPAVLDATFPGRRGFDVVWITIDTLRADRLSLYGYGRPTSPAMVALGEESVVFERAYAQHPSSSLSFLSMLTSRYPSAFADRKGSPPKDLGPLLTDVREGRRTVAVTPLQHGYVDRVMPYLLIGMEGIETLGRAQIPDASRVFAQARKRMAENGDGPTFAFIHLFDPHEPYRPHPETPTFPESKRSDPDSDRYDAEVAWADRHLGEFLSWMKTRPSWQRTVVIIAGDHGESLGEYGGMTDHGTGVVEQQVHVPLIIRVPGAQPRRVADPVELIDILPTLEELLAVVPTTGHHGHSLVGHLVPDDRREDVERPGPFAYVQFIRDGESVDAVIGSRYKLVRNHNAGVDELFDLSRDEPEAHDLALGNPPELATLRAQAAAFRLLARTANVAPTRRQGHGKPGTRIARLQKQVESFYGGDPEAIPRLVDVVREDPADSNGLTGLRVLALLTPRAALPLLRDLSTHPDESLRVRVAAWIALGAQEGSRKVLEALSRDEASRVAITALAGLALQGDARGAEALRAARPTDPEAGRWILAARAALGDPDALRALGSVVLTIDAGPEPLLAAWAAGRNHPETGIHVDLYLRAANPQDHPVARLALARAIGTSTDVARVAPILRALLDPGGSSEAKALRRWASEALHRMAPGWASKLERVEGHLRDMRAAAQAGRLPTVLNALSAAKKAAADDTYTDWGLILEERIVANTSNRVQFAWPDAHEAADALLTRQRAQDALPLASNVKVLIEMDAQGAWVDIALSAPDGTAIAGGFHTWGPYVRVDVLDAGGKVLRHRRLPLPSRGIASDVPLRIVQPIDREPGATTLRVQVVIPGRAPLMTRDLPIR